MDRKYPKNVTSGGCQNIIFLPSDHQNKPKKLCARHGETYSKWFKYILKMVTNTRHAMKKNSHAVIFKAISSIYAQNLEGFLRN